MSDVQVLQPRRGPRDHASDATVRRAAWWQLGLPFLLVHVAAVLGVVLVGWSPLVLVAAAVSYLTRAFGITGFYHRCFSHRAFKVGRPVQLVGALLGAAAAQKGPLWWVGHHRVHHRHSDEPGDVHSPRHGFWHSHVLWVFSPANERQRVEEVSDLAAFGELRWIDRFHYVVTFTFASAWFVLGVVLHAIAPGLDVDGPRLLVWGFFVPTVALYHATFSVNSIAHRLGRRRYETSDDSRNNWVIALVALGEGWHNNHHKFPPGARQGWARWELDPTWLVIRALERVGLARELRPVPAAVMAVARPPSR